MNVQVLSTENGLEQQCEQLQHRLSIREKSVVELAYPAADIGDRALAIAERDRNLALQRLEQRMLAQLNHAIERNENGHRGRCEDCGQPIDSERLKVMPEATRCKPCKEERERILGGRYCWRGNGGVL